MVPPNFSIIQCTSGTLSLVFGILCFVNYLGSSRTYEHHELINPFIMKSEVKYNEDMF